MKNLTKILFRSKRQFIFLCSIFVLTLFNTYSTFDYIKKIQKIKHVIPYQFDGFKFSGLNEFFQNVEYVSYFTDRDLKDEDAVKQFSQAQYMLAPTILDPDNMDHPYMLVDCANPAMALRKMKEFNVVPVKRNQFGIILAKRDG